MSSILLGGAGLGVSQFIQGLTTNTSASSATAANTSTSGIASQFLSNTSEALHHRHQGSGLFHQIQQAVTSALQSSGTTSSAAANQTVQNAIAQVLKSNATANPSFATSNSADSQTNQTFLQTLAAHGITPEQFRSDLISAMQQEQNSGVDVSNVANQIPPGMLVNAVG